jgi:hypothetical protein
MRNFGEERREPVIWRFLNLNEGCDLREKEYGKRGAIVEFWPIGRREWFN